MEINSLISSPVSIELTAINTRVAEKRCIDCGEDTKGLAGYCSKNRCGYMENYIHLTAEEIAKAVIQNTERIIRKNRFNKLKKI